MRIYFALLFLLSGVLAFGQSYYLPQIPRLNTVSSTDLVPIWSGTNLYSATASAAGIGGGKLNATNGNALNLTVTGGFDTSGGTGPLLVDDANDRIAFRGAGGTSPFNVRANNVRFGADDGVGGLSSITPSFAKDINFYSYDYNLNDWGLFRGESSSTINSLTIGFASGGNRGATTLRFKLASSVSDASGTLIATANSSGFTFLTPLTVSGDSTSLYVDTVNNRVAVRGGGGSMPFNVLANVMRFGADDGAITNASATAGTDKDLTFASYDKQNNDWGFIRASSDGSGNTLNLGGGPGGYRGPTVVNIQASSSTNSTSRSTLASFDGVNTRMSIGNSSTLSGAVLVVNSTNQASVPVPRQSSSEWAAYTPPQGGMAYQTTANKLVIYDGSVRRFISENLTGTAVWDIPNITAGTEQTTTLTVTGAAVGDQVLVDATRPATNVIVVGMVTSSNTVTLYAMNTGATIDPGSRTFRVTVIRQ
jgi:hypothetical protein